jgi:iron complex transport system substrate-binding protein
MDRTTRTTRTIRTTSLGILAVALLVLATLLAGCAADTTADAEPDPAAAPAEEASTDAGADTADEASGAFPVTITDDAGREVTIDEAPERIVSLAPANTEILFAIGMGDALVGVTTYDDYPPEVESIPEVGDFVTPNMEAISAAEPDLVLGTTGIQEDVISRLEDLGIAVVAVDPQDLEEVFAAIEMVGDACGRDAEASAITEEMRAELSGIDEAVGDIEAVECFVEIAQEPLFTAGSGTLIDDLVTAAGGRNVVTEEGYVAYSAEQLLQHDPAVYLATLGSMSDPSELQDRPGFDTLEAVREGRVHVLEDNLVSRPGPRIVEGVRTIDEALHPEAFE